MRVRVTWLQGIMLRVGNVYGNNQSRITSDQPTHFCCPYLLWVNWVNHKVVQKGITTPYRIAHLWLHKCKGKGCCLVTRKLSFKLLWNCKSESVRGVAYYFAKMEVYVLNCNTLLRLLMVYDECWECSIRRRRDNALLVLLLRIWALESDIDAHKMKL